MTKEKGGLHLVGDAIDGVKPAPVLDEPRRERDKRTGGPDEPELPLLPAGCPVQPLGKLGQVCFFLDEAGQLIALDPQKVGKNHIRNLFGRRSYLCDEYWPRHNADGEITGWKPEIAGDLLMRACAWEGIFDPQGHVRGRGAHLGVDGELILHRGDKVYFAGCEDSGYSNPGLIGKFVYPTAPALPRPDPEAIDTAPAEELLALFRTWEWARPLADPLLLLGWVGAAMIGGALRWRPHVWVTGSSSTGKSTLQELLELLFDGAALHTHDATEAALRQLLKQQTLPVFFDELESEEDNRRNKAVIKLARLASSGAVVLRGGQDHQGHEFVARSCFLFSSILLPPMLSQDRNRMAVLDLERLPKGKARPDLNSDHYNQLGRMLMKRMAEQWHRLDQTMRDYHSALMDQGHSSRGADQFGALLTCADLLLYDESDEDVIAERAEMLAASNLTETATGQSDEEEIVDFLANSFMPFQRGGDEPEPIVRLLHAALEPDGDRARTRLENIGLKIMHVTVENVPGGEAKRSAKARKQTDPAHECHLAICNAHEALERVFKDQRWAEGVWSQSFGRVVGGHKRVKVRYAGGKSQWSTLIPLTAILEFASEE